ncbi:DUF222 domain-containing protein [Pseudokineococcus marinus]|uniref:DUF222 domain-containing protein n=2 Tax=Pseudokineococcus marinus TaxID=351215 RepID=A0A849BI85_9ACTN|nr:DUF222 domain-containing protein [Pseudokineococcus marinus]NNH22890.1 DUF222 domain-containing protein [Pseudokineococcus marinus]
MFETGVGGADGHDAVRPSASPGAGRGASPRDGMGGAAAGEDGGVVELVGEVGRVRSAVRAGALGRVQAVVALEVARSVAWAGLLRQVAALVDEVAASGGPAALLSDAGDGAGAGWTAGVATRTAGASADPHPAPGRDAGVAFEAAAGELAVALVVPLRRAQDVVAEALAVTTRLPVTLAALEAGRIDPQRSRLVADETVALSVAHAAAVDAALAGDLGPLTVPALRARVRHLVATTDPEAVRRRVRRATCARGVRLFPVDDGMAQLVATGPVLDLACVFERLTTTARARAGEHGRVDPHAATSAGLDPLALSDGGTGLPDRRGIDARRFDALVDLATTTDLPAGQSAAADVAATATTVTPRARSPHGPQVTVALSSLLGLDDDPAQHPTLGPVPAVAAAELLANGHRFRRALTAPLTGHLIGLDGHLLTTEPTTTTAAATTTAGSSTTAPPDPPRKGRRTAPARRDRAAAITVRVDTPDDRPPSPPTSPAPASPPADPAETAHAVAAERTAAPEVAAGMTAATAASVAAGPANAAGTAQARAAGEAIRPPSPPPSPPGLVTGSSSTSRHASLRRAARRPGCSYAAAAGRARLLRADPGLRPLGEGPLTPLPGPRLPDARDPLRPRPPAHRARPPARRGPAPRHRAGRRRRRA